MDPKGQMLMHAYFLYFRFSGFAKPLLTGEIKFKHRRKSLFKNLNIFKTNIANKIYAATIFENSWALGTIVPICMVPTDLCAEQYI